MDHKAKCKVMKKMRKQIADAIGVELHQTECTYQGECSGTCPKCAQEEKILNRALLGGTAVAVGLTLTACTTPTGGLMKNDTEDGTVNEFAPNTSTEVMEGDVVKIPETDLSTDEYELIVGEMEIAPETKETPEWMSDISLEGETDCDAGECD